MVLVFDLEFVLLNLIILRIVIEIEYVICGFVYDLFIIVILLECNVYDYCYYVSCFKKLKIVVGRDCCRF